MKEVAGCVLSVSWQNRNNQEYVENRVQFFQSKSIYL